MSDSRAHGIYYDKATATALGLSLHPVAAGAKAGAPQARGSRAASPPIGSWSHTSETPVGYAPGTTTTTLSSTYILVGTPQTKPT